MPYVTAASVAFWVDNSSRPLNEGDFNDHCQKDQKVRLAIRGCTTVFGWPTALAVPLVFIVGWAHLHMATGTTPLGEWATVG